MKLARSLFVGISLIVSFCAHGQRVEYKDCYVTLHHDTLTIGNSKIVQQFLWNQGALQSIRLTDVVNRYNLSSYELLNNLHLLGESVPDSASWSAQETKRFATESSYLQVEIISNHQHLSVKTILEVHPEVPALSVSYQFKGSTQATWQISISQDQQMIESNLSANTSSARLGAMVLKGIHWNVRAVQFQDATDHHNNLVKETEFIPYRKPIPIKGNILVATDAKKGNSFFLLKESPLGFSQHAYPGYDFMLSQDQVEITGLGVTEKDLHQKQWVSSYRYTVGVAATSDDVLIALRQYQKTRRKILPARDEMILINTWGDRARDSRMSETFILNELDQAKKLGVTHLQLDDGWQVGLSRNSASAQGALWDDWTTESWQPHPQRFPNGLTPIVKKAKQLGIEIGLWFNASKVNSYQAWSRDADILISYYQQYGIRTFKMDGLELSDKQAEENLRLFFEKITHATQGAVVFNFDVTAGSRFGYHYFTEYGNIFLENRYTDWANYYPHWTLRNLWLLSRYVPAEKLQIEFLNKWRNENKYAVNDSFAPTHYSFDYLIAISLMGQPLAWLEASSLPEKAFEASDLLKKYESIRTQIHEGIILPIGEEPSGRSWTGFQSTLPAGKTGFLLIFREDHEDKTASIKTFLPPGKKINLTKLAGTGKAARQTSAKDGSLNFSLPDKKSFVLYQFEILN